MTTARAALILAALAAVLAAQPTGGGAAGTIAQCPGTLPACSASIQGSVCYSIPTSGNYASVELCGQTSTGYAWQPLGGGQPSPNCGDLSLSPTSAALHDGAGGSGMITGAVTDQSCQWTASSSQSWLTITSGASNTGNAFVDWSASANTADDRSATITARTSIFTLSQQSPPIGDIDLWLPFTDGLTVGQSVTDGNLCQGTLLYAGFLTPTCGGWTDSGSLSNFTICNSTHALGASVALAGSPNITYERTTPANGLCFANGAFQTARLALPNTGDVTSMGWWHTFGATNDSPSGQIYDELVVFASSGAYAAFQLKSGDASNCYCLWIEAGPGDTHSPQIHISQGTTYWVSMYVDFRSGVANACGTGNSSPCAEVGMWDTSYANVGTIEVALAQSNVTVSELYFGNNEIGASPSTTTIYSNFILQYGLTAQSTPVFPLGPRCPNC